jgi:hypothetical protein
VYIREASLDAVVVMSQPLMIDTQQMQQVGMKIRPAGAIFCSLPTNFIGGSVSSTSWHTGPSHPDRESILIVIASGTELIRR